MSTPSVSDGTSVCAFVQPPMRENDAPNWIECLPRSQLTVLSMFQLLPLRDEGAALVVALVSAGADAGEPDVEAGLIVELAEVHLVGEPHRRVRDADAQLVDEVGCRASTAASPSRG